uniref:Cytochrome P450 n=1 Tax=Acrobeloides nanus TaxID=290746 RepID=A0A914CDE9_9BILA
MDIMDIMGHISEAFNTVMKNLIKMEDESEFYRLKNLISENARLLGHPLSLIMNMTNITFWRKFPYFKELLNKLLDNNEQLLKFFESQIEKNRKLFATEGDIQEATNYVQAYLMEMKKREEYGNVGDFTRLQLKCMLHDLWVAGQETTSNTLNFAVLYLMTHLRVQSKMQAELDQVVGHGRKVSLADKPNLHYTNATINEIQRLCNLLPVNLFHRTTKDVHINGYNISKGTVIVPQICAVLFDEKVGSYSTE